MAIEITRTIQLSRDELQMLVNCANGEIEPTQSGRHPRGTSRLIDFGLIEQLNDDGPLYVLTSEGKEIVERVSRPMTIRVLLPEGQIPDGA